MSKQEDTLNKAYGSVPKEVGYTIDFDFVPGWRGVKFYWYKLIRSMQGRGSTSCDCGHKH